MTQQELDALAKAIADGVYAATTFHMKSPIEELNENLVATAQQISKLRAEVESLKEAVYHLSKKS